MSTSTQISGNIHPGNTALQALKTMLAFIGVRVTHPTKDESLFYETDMGAVWRKYDNELEFYWSIAESSFHIVYNDGDIDDEIGLQILYAMLKDRPIVMTGAPVFANDLSLFVRETLEAHMHAFHAIKLTELELAELSVLLQKLKPINYRLSKREQILIHARVKSLFRNLLREAKELRIAKVRDPNHPIEEN